MNFLLDSKQVCSDSLRAKLEKDEFAFYNSNENRRAYKITTSTANPDRPEMHRCLYVIPYSKLNLQVGFMRTVEISAGQEYSTVVEVEKPRSIVSIML